MELYFSDYFHIDSAIVENYGAFDVSVVTDLPLFIDPFLLFHSANSDYQLLHQEILKYLTFLRDHAKPDLDPALIKSWYQFKEVKQNWLGFTHMGNGGRGLGQKFAQELYISLASILSGFGSEVITKSSHLEKLALIRRGVGRDNVSDFTTNLIKRYLLEYTERFARQYITEDLCGYFNVPKSVFNYETENWETRKYFLPKLGSDFVLLTPFDLLSKDDTWINRDDMIRHYDRLPAAVSDDVMRGQINRYFGSILGKKPTSKERLYAAEKTIFEFPILIDVYIRDKELNGRRAVEVSSAKRTDLREVLVHQVRLASEDITLKCSNFIGGSTSYEEARGRVLDFKDYVENRDGYRVINRGNGQPFSKESEVQTFFALLLYNSEYDVNREVNNGRGPVDIKISKGSRDKSLIEFKLASNPSLKRNLQNQVTIYEKANRTKSSVKVIICYSQADQAKVSKVLSELKLKDDESVVVIDARSDNKPSASKA